MGYNDDNENKALIDLQMVRDLGAATAKPQQLAGYRSFVLVPEGFKAETLQPLHQEPLPDHIRQTVRLDEVASFIDYVKTFKQPESRLFATTTDTGARFTAILDYHLEDPAGLSAANHCTHKATFEPKYSPEFQAWLDVNRKPLTQDLFLDHLRRWGHTITSHEDADLIEITSSLEFKSEGQFSSQIERVKGGKRLTWTEDVTGQGNVKGTAVPVPEEFIISVPIFTGGLPAMIRVELLYRVKNGALTIAPEMKREQLKIREAVKELVEKTQTETEIKIFIGQPA